MQPIHAVIDGNAASALGIEAHGSSPVLALCRVLVEAGYDPALPLHAYRGDTLALKVRTIGEGAQLTVTDSNTGKPVFRRWRDRAAMGGGALPMRQKELPAPTSP
jgi:hypothetical protein